MAPLRSFASGFASLALLALAAAQSSSRLRVEYLESPIGLDEPTPRFSWALEHPDRGQGMTAYEIVVSSGGSTVWDSGKVSGTRPTNVPYGGSTALASDTDYTWTVTWWDNAGTQSTPATGTWSTGLFNPADWQGAAFVGGPGGVNTLRSEFTVGGYVTRARLYIIGLGYYRAWINGQLTDNHELGPFTTFEKRILYDTWDVTNLVHQGW
jgi:alpha-L-rhamnosidase